MLDETLSINGVFEFLVSVDTVLMLEQVSRTDPVVERWCIRVVDLTGSSEIVVLFRSRGGCVDRVGKCRLGMIGIKQQRSVIVPQVEEPGI